jgi:hypothetical protein
MSELALTILPETAADAPAIERPARAHLWAGAFRAHGFPHS